MAALLLHSLQEFDEIIFELISRTRPRSVLEIGSENGGFSEKLLERCAEFGAKFTSIDPKPAAHLVKLAENSATFDAVIGLSVPYLAEKGCDHDFVLIDGDHNFYTVSRELELIHASWNQRNISGTILLHDVGFPCGRRDCYYAPNQIPPESRHRHSFALGVTLDSPNLVRGGFRGEGHFAWALDEGGERNGVLGAVEHFSREHPEYSYRSVDAVFGLGALTHRGSDAESAVEAVFSRYDHALIRRLERNRLELYLKVLELQDLLAERDANARSREMAAARQAQAPANVAAPSAESTLTKGSP